MIKYLKLLLGIFLMALGGVFYLQSNIGGDPLTILFQGVSNTFSLPYGNVVTLMNIIFIIVLFIFDKKKIGIATFAVGIFLGISFNIIFYINVIPFSTNFIQSIIYSFIGVLTGAYGVAIYIESKLGVSGVEGTMLLIKEKFSIRIRTAKIIQDGIILGVGYVLGGVFGVGTIIAWAFMGPAIDFFLCFKKAKSSQLN